MNLPLIEKWRPKTFDEVIGVERLEEIKEHIKVPMNMPNMLFYGSPGTGKTTVAKIIVETLKPIDVLRINGSDDTGVDTIRDKVHNFVSSMSSEKDKPKLVWIEEFDYPSASAYAALRAMIEQYIKNARYLCTANFLNKIPEPIQSRFSLFEFKKPSMAEVFKRVSDIAKEEKIEKNVMNIVKKSNGDIRTAINTLQCGTESNIINSIDVYNMIKEKNWIKIRYELPLTNPDYYTLLIELSDLSFKDESISNDKKAEINEKISEGIVEMRESFDHNIAFSAICSRIIKLL